MSRLGPQGSAAGHAPVIPLPEAFVVSIHDRRPSRDSMWTASRPSMRQMTTHRSRIVKSRPKTADNAARHATQPHKPCRTQQPRTGFRQPSRLDAATQTPPRAAASCTHSRAESPQQPAAPVRGSAAMAPDASYPPKSPCKAAAPTRGGVVNMYGLADILAGSPRQAAAFPDPPMFHMKHPTLLSARKPRCQHHQPAKPQRDTALKGRDPTQRYDKPHKARRARQAANPAGPTPEAARGDPDSA